MATQLVDELPPLPIPEQRFILPGRHSWKQFKTFESLIDESFPGVRLFYLDGCIELLTISPEHETLKCILALLLGFYFVEMDISFTPTGSATLEKAEESRAEPNLSYFFGKPTGVPDLTIEVALTSGGASKLERYKRLSVPEVWFWENNKFSLYHLRGENYQEIACSEFLPDLDLALLAECLQIPDRKEALKFFRNAIQAARG